MKVRIGAVSATCTLVLLLGAAIVPPSADASPPFVPPPAPVPVGLPPTYIRREANASPAMRAQLAQHRQRVQANHLNYKVGYTTAMDRPREALAGTRVPADLPQRIAAMEPKSRAALRIYEPVLNRIRQATPAWPRVTDRRADFRAAFNGTFTLDGVQGTVPPIRNQGNCGSCFAMAPSEAFEWSRLIMGVSVVASPQSILSCAGAGSAVAAGVNPMDECAHGGRPDDVLQWMEHVGAQRESEYPYAEASVACTQTGQWPTVVRSCTPVPACRTPYVADLRLGAWGYLRGQATLPTTAEIKSWLASYGPIVVGVYADFWNSYAGGVFSGGGTVIDDTLIVDHAVVLIGWDDSQDPGAGHAPGAWIVQNSWGNPSTTPPGQWGESAGFGTETGYMYLAYGSSNVGGVAYWVGAHQFVPAVP
jgi:cathepsin L